MEHELSVNLSAEKYTPLAVNLFSNDSSSPSVLITIFILHTSMRANYYLVYPILRFRKPYSEFNYFPCRFMDFVLFV